MKTLKVAKGGVEREFTFRDDEPDELERSRRDFLLAGWGVEVDEGRERVTVSDGRQEVVLEAWPEHGAWYEADRPNEIGALMAPMDNLDAPSAPAFDDLITIEVLWGDA